MYEGALAGQSSLSGNWLALGEAVSPGPARSQVSKHQEVKRNNSYKSLSAKWELRVRNQEQGAGKLENENGYVGTYYSPKRTLGGFQKADHTWANSSLLSHV